MIAKNIAEYDELIYVGKKPIKWKEDIYDCDCSRGDACDCVETKCIRANDVIHIGQVSGTDYDDVCGCITLWASREDAVLLVAPGRPRCSCLKEEGALKYVPEDWNLHKSGQSKRMTKAKNSVKRVFQSYRTKITNLKERMKKRLNDLDLPTRLQFRSELSEKDAKIFDALIE